MNLENNTNTNLNNSNIIKVKKNNKLIYMNKNLIKPKKKISIIGNQKRRSSFYRGVSKNGNKWQVIIFFNGKPRYIGNYDSQEIAARIYDIISIKKLGVKAKTNFEYNIQQIQKINEAYVDYKFKFIDEVIYDLIK